MKTAVLVPIPLFIIFCNKTRLMLCHFLFCHENKVSQMLITTTVAICTTLIFSLFFNLGSWPLNSFLKICMPKKQRENGQQNQMCTFKTIHLTSPVQILHEQDCKYHTLIFVILGAEILIHILLTIDCCRTRNTPNNQFSLKPKVCNPFILTGCFAKDFLRDY